MIIDMNNNILNENQIKEYIRDKKVIIYASSTRNKLATDTFLKDKVEYICDKDSDKWDTLWNNIPIYSVDKLKEEDMSKCVLYTIISDYSYINEIISKFGVQYALIDMKRYDNLYFERFVDGEEFQILNKAFLEREKKFRFVNFIQDEKFLIPLWNVIYNHFDISEHLFVVHSINFTNCNDQYNLWDKYISFSKQHGNIYILDNVYNFARSDVYEHLEKLEKVLEYCEKIVFHSGQLTHAFEEYFSKHMDWVTNKTEMIMWGAERFYDKNHKFFCDFISEIRNVWCSARLIKKLDEKYKFKDLHLKEGLTYAYYENVVSEKLTHGTTNILLGHSGSVQIEHLKYLKILEKFKDRDVSITCIFSYDVADVERINSIIDYGTKAFGDKFVVVKEYIEFEDYPKFLDKIDIGIFPVLKKCGTTTLNLMLKLNKKVYVNHALEYWPELFVDKYTYRDCDRLIDESFDEFITNNQNKSIEMHEADDCFVEMWREVY